MTEAQEIEIIDLDMNEVKENWRKLGEYFGYPQCCIDEFVSREWNDIDLDQVKAGRGTGFIPCKKHAAEILQGLTTLESLVQNRQHPFPFPHDLELLQRDQIQLQINTLPSEQRSTLSDGYHTFDELYEFMKLYNAALFNEWALRYWENQRMMAKGWMVDGQDVTHPRYNVHKSWRHHDGELCFGGGWFIVCAQLPSGQISNHYKAEDWDLFRIPEVPKALYPFDGHTPADVLQRLKAVL